jgi:cytochrome c553
MRSTLLVAMRQRLTALALCFLTACSRDNDARPNTSAPEDVGAVVDAASVVPDERLALCARPADDAVRDIFCRGDRVSVSSLRELLTRLEIETLPVGMDEAGAAKIKVEDISKPDDSVVFLAHSTALSGQLVSAINPRAIRMNKVTLIAFQRGIQKVEIATLDRVTQLRNFYLITFSQACNETPTGCGPGDLYTLSIERDWASVTLEDDEDLKNTPRDCRNCHKRQAPQLSLLMRELQGPWSHFFLFDNELVPERPEGGPPGRDSVREYLRAKGSESYAGVPIARIRQTAGVTLQRAVIGNQPLQFASAIPAQLETAESGRSSIWDFEYARFKRGEQLALPYYKQSAADPEKLAALSDAYTRYRSGELQAADLPDLADIFPDAAQVRAEIGLQTEPNATPAELLIQACAMCHNDALDQTISRARFNINLAHMDRAELDLAIARIELPQMSETAMPPHGMRQLDSQGKALLVAYLRADTRTAEDDALLESAARLGMVGDGPKY